MWVRLVRGSRPEGRHWYKSARRSKLFLLASTVLRLRLRLHPPRAQYSSLAFSLSLSPRAHPRTQFERVCGARGARSGAVHGRGRLFRGEDQDGGARRRRRRRGGAPRARGCRRQRGAPWRAGEGPRRPPVSQVLSLLAVQCGRARGLCLLGVFGCLCFVQLCLGILLRF
jgi:hypothetical protein